MNAIDIFKQDPEYLHQRRKELQPYLDLFVKQLAQFISIAPPVICVDLQTGEFHSGTTPDWQQQIDRLKEEQLKYLQSEFPEFYPTQQLQKKD